MKKNLYFDKIKDIITIEEYKEYSNQIVNDTIKQDKILMDLENKLDIIDNKMIPEEDYSKVIEEYLSMKHPSVYLLASIIDRIIINKDKEITIKYKIKNPEGYLNSIDTYNSV